MKGHQVVARSCYATSLPGEIKPETLTIKDPRDEKDGMSPVEDIVQIILDPGFPDRLVGIRSLLRLELQEKLV